MQAASDRLDFTPPSTPGLVRSVGLALIAHALLMLALTWGVNWKRETQTIAVEAELWSALPQAAAPPEVLAPPEPPVPLKMEAKVEPWPEPKISNADIALEREKDRKAKLKLAQEKLNQEKKLAEEKKKKELEAKNKDKDKLKAQEELKQAEKRRQENIQRMTGLAGATGAATATGTALTASGPSASYAGRIVARVKPNIVFSEDTSSNPSAEVEVRTAPDGTILSRKLLKSSSSKAWDEAILKAIDKTEILPRDTDGRVPPVLVITFRPKD